MSTAVQERPAEVRDPLGLPPTGGRPARRAVVRWAWRLFQREWRQQFLVLALLTIAVAATTAGLAVATNTSHTPRTIFQLPGHDPQLAADVAAIEQHFGPAVVMHHQRVPIPGSVSTLDVRAPATGNPTNSATLRLVGGRYPTGPNEVAVTKDVASRFDLRIGSAWTEDGRTRQVVGLVENPENLTEQFALVPPGQADPPQRIEVVLHGAPAPFGFHLPSGAPLQIIAESSNARTAASIIVLSMASVGLLFVGLVGVAGFTVMAQRRMRALGMFGSLGASDRHVQLVMLSNGAVVGLVAAAVGAVAGLAGWLAFAPRLENIAQHRIDRFDLPWWAVGLAIVLAVATALVAAWWPGRAAARMPVVAALSGRPPQPQPGRRFAALGSVLLAMGVGFLFLARAKRPPLVVSGAMITVVGVLLLAPLAIRALAMVGKRAPIAVRLALRDLVRYQARSGAALGAVTLALAIAVSIAVSATARAATDGSTLGNLPANELVVHLGANPKSLDLPPDVVPQLDAAHIAAARARVDQIAASVGAKTVVPVFAAINPTDPTIPPDGPGGGGREAASLVRAHTQGNGVSISLTRPFAVATPEVLAHFGLSAARIDPSVDMLSPYAEDAQLQLGYGRDSYVAHPKMQLIHVTDYSSEPTTMITMAAVQRLSLQVVPFEFLVQASHPLTPAQIDQAQRQAASAGLAIQSRRAQRSLGQLGKDATLVGMVFALAVLAMTVGLIRSETAGDLRTLTATGAGTMTRRTLTGATAGALALLGALLGTAAAYAALLAWHRADEWTLGHVPYFNLTLLLVGLPAVALVGGWLFAGREPPAISRQPLE